MTLVQGSDQAFHHRSCRPGLPDSVRLPRATRRAFLLSGLGGALVSLTGCAGGVSRYVDGVTSYVGSLVGIGASADMRTAAEVINGMPPERVFAHLHERLPFEETRLYLAKVTDARNNYRAWDETLVSRK